MIGSGSELLKASSKQNPGLGEALEVRLVNSEELSPLKFSALIPAHCPAASAGEESIGLNHRIKDDRIEKYGSLFVFISK